MDCDCARAGAGVAPEDPDGWSSFLLLCEILFGDRARRDETGTDFVLEVTLVGDRCVVALVFERGWPLAVPQVTGLRLRVRGLSIFFQGAKAPESVESIK